ncbi:MAG TPA: hypothetical protein VFQ80_09970 [Thermomicrobiales bacterium]|nr:hypothetical protein [Thermomicrobiales bacterium]
MLTRHGAFQVGEFPDAGACSGASFTADGAGAFTPPGFALVVTVLVD